MGTENWRGGELHMGANNPVFHKQCVHDAGVMKKTRRGKLINRINDEESC